MIHKPNQQQRGATLIGYGLVIGLIGVIALAALQQSGQTIRSLFEDVGSSLDEARAASGNGTSAGDSPVQSFAASCADLQASGVTTDGIQQIDPDQTGQAISTWCDMTSQGGGWALMGVQLGSAPYQQRTTSNIGNSGDLGSFDAASWRFGNATIQRFAPDVAWRIEVTETASGNVTENGWFRPTCVIDWDQNVGGSVGSGASQITFTEVPECSQAFSDASFTNFIEDEHRSGNSSVGIGHNDITNVRCAIRMASHDGAPSSLPHPGAYPCIWQDFALYSIRLWVK